MGRNVFGEVRVRNLIWGLILIFIAVALIVLVYSYFSGMTSGGGDIVLKREGISGLSMVMFAILLFGLLGGFEIGRYVQTESIRRRKETEE